MKNFFHPRARFSTNPSFAQELTRAALSASHLRELEKKPNAKVAKNAKGAKNCFKYGFRNASLSSPSSLPSRGC
jgi:hypothetical protein